MKISMKQPKSLLYAMDNERTLQEGFEEFLQDCEARNLSNKTIEYYKNCYKILLKVEDTDEEILLEESTKLATIQPQDINLINRYLLNNYKETSVNSYLRGIRAIFTSLWTCTIWTKCR